MRAFFLAFALVALVSLPSPVSSDSGPVARDRADARSLEHDIPRAVQRSPKQYRRNYTPDSPLKKRQESPVFAKRNDWSPKPSPVWKRNDDSWPKPSPVWKRHDDGWAPKPSPVWKRHDDGWAPKPSPVWKRDDDSWAPKPSPVWKRNDNQRRSPAEDESHRRSSRSLEDQSIIGSTGGPTWHPDDQCPAPLMACPVRGAPDADAFECVDLLSDLDSCGGCAADDIAFDCTAIANARGVECVSGFCEVRSCTEGYVVALSRDMCVRQ